MEIKLENKMFRDLSEGAKTAFSAQSDNYKQKLVYTLLETIKATDRERFREKLLRALNARKAESTNLINLLKREDVEKVFRTKGFDDIAYAIVMGIMSSYSEKEV